MAPPIKAQLTLSGVAIAGVGSYIDASLYPVLTVRFRSTRAGQPVKLALKDVYILEVNKYRNPQLLTEESVGLYTAVFATSIYNPVLGSRPTAVTGAVTITAMQGNEVASLEAAWNMAPFRGAALNVNDDRGFRVPLYLDFGAVVFDRIKELSLRIDESTRDGSGNERAVSLQSISTRSNNFSISWLGTGGTPRLPTNILSGTSYRFNVTCSPSRREPISDVMTIIFEGGSRVDILLSANTPTYEPASLLKIVRPNGGENYAPCENVKIAWQGSLQGFYAHVEYSTNSGKDWTLIDSTLDSTLVWVVPSFYSDSTTIRVFQKQITTGARWLRGEQSPATALAFDMSGRFLAVAYESGALIEWDVVTETLSNRYTVSGIVAPSSVVSTLCYVGGNREILAVVDRGLIASDQIQKFRPGQAGSVGTINTPIERVVRIATDSTGAKAFVIGSPSAVISTYDVATLAASAPISLTAPSSSASIEKNILSVSLIDGDVVQYAMTSGLEQRRFKTGLPQAGLAATLNMTVSRTTRLFALAGSAYSGSLNTPQEQRTILYDTKSGSVIRVFYRLGSNSVGCNINANETFLTLGYSDSPQITQYDISKRVELLGGTALTHFNAMTGIEYGPDGATLASCSRDLVDNVLIRRISKPESDVSDAAFSISRVKLEYSNIFMGNRYIGTSADTIITALVCNRGVTPAIFESGRLLNGTWMTLLDSIATDTIAPGACITMRFRVAPLDTGMLYDTLQLRACDETFNVAFTLRSADRSITMFGNLTDFGDVCVGDTVARTITLLRNNDPIGLPIDGITMRQGVFSAFRVRNVGSGVVVAPGASLDVDLFFIPRRLGKDTDEVVVSYAGQINVTRTIRLIGQGSGADVRPSHETLAFIPEISERTVVLSNYSANDVVLTSATVPPGAPFTLLTNVPLTIGGNDSIALRIRYNGGLVSGTDIIALEFTPCAAAVGIGLVAYSGSAIVSAPTVRADPRGDVKIPITATSNEAIAYKGDRPFEGVMRVNPRLFLATSITSKLGPAQILSQDIVDGLRHIRFSVTGSFMSTQEIATLIGPAGLAEVDSSVLDFDTAASAFGKAVNVSYRKGLLNISNPDPNRRILHPMALTITGVFPQPASNEVTVNVTSGGGNSGIMSLIDAHGQVLLSRTVFCAQGNQSFSIDTHGVAPGLHLILISSGTTFTSMPVVVLR